MLRFRSRRDALSILDRVRATNNLHSTLAYIKQGDLLMQSRTRSAAASVGVAPRAASSTESLLTIFHPFAYPKLVPLDDSSAALGLRRKRILEATVGDEDLLTQEDIDSARDISKPRKLRDERIQRVKASRWTSVTDEDAIVANLISLYLSWDHATVRIFDENYFVEQLVAGEKAYCSPMLVNAILAVATLNYKAIDDVGASKLSSRFYEEAERLWKKEETQGGLLMVPTSILMDVWWKAHDNSDLGAVYLARGIEVTRALGLFEVSYSRDQGWLSRQDRKGRAIIAWGIFNWKGIDALITQRDGHFSSPPAASIPYDPTIFDEDVSEWDSFPLVRPHQEIDSQETFRSMCQFCMILHEHIDLRSRLAVAADKEAYVGDVQAIFVKLLKWADNLPPAMTRTPGCLPLVLDTHMFYHYTIMELFQPFIHDKSSTGLLAQDVASASLAQLRRIVYIQRFCFGGPPVTSATIHAIHILAHILIERITHAEEPDTEAEFYAILCVDALSQVSVCYPVARAVLRNLSSRASTREARDRLPPEVLSVFRSAEGAFKKPTGGKRREMDVETMLLNPRKDVINWLDDATGELQLA